MDSKDHAVAASVTWADCIGQATWLTEPLHTNLRYPHPLPVQQVVIPTVSRALLSGVPMDVSLTAPTGSGKTLCYLLPMLRLVTAERRGVNDARLRAIVLVPTPALGQQVSRELDRLTRRTTIAAASLCDESRSMEAEAERMVRRVRAVADAERAVDVVGDYHYFSRVDALVATPQRLLQHLDHTPGLSLASLRLLVIDEADQVLAGNFASLVVKVVERFEEEQQARAARELSTGMARSTAPALEDPMGRLQCGMTTLHKLLCSATLSSRISRISEVRLRNCQYFALDTNGGEVAETGDGTDASTGAKSGMARTAFALPPTLQEHIVFVEDAYRHAVLLKLVRALLTRMAEQREARQRLRERANAQEEMEEAGEKDSKATPEKEPAVSTPPAGARAAPPSYPSADPDAGSGILVFCSSADEARVMGHFLSAAGVTGVVEFTTLTTESERRRALLQPNAAAGAPRVVVASDALMRGIDIPDTGHVIMYHPPTSLSQYVHRAGRTARAMRPGHLHLLLSKLGPSHTQEDGEVAHFRRLSGLVTRTLPQRYERHFFLFTTAPASAAVPRARRVSTAGGVGAGTEPEPTTRPEPTTTAAGEAAEVASAAEAAARPAEWWVEEANRFLARTTHRLQRRWASVLEMEGAGEPAPQPVVGTKRARPAASATE